MSKTLGFFLSTLFAISCYGMELAVPAVLNKAQISQLQINYSRHLHELLLDNAKSADGKLTDLAVLIEKISPQMRGLPVFDMQFVLNINPLDTLFTKHKGHRACTCQWSSEDNSYMTFLVECKEPKNVCNGSKVIIPHALRIAQSLTFDMKKAFLILQTADGKLIGEAFCLIPFNAEQRAYLLMINFFMEKLKSAEANSLAFKMLLDEMTKALAQHPVLHTFCFMKNEQPQIAWSIITHIYVVLNTLRSSANLEAMSETYQLMAFNLWQNTNLDFNNKLNALTAIIESIPSRDLGKMPLFDNQKIVRITSIRDIVTQYPLAHFSRLFISSDKKNMKIFVIRTAGGMGNVPATPADIGNADEMPIDAGGPATNPAAASTTIAGTVPLGGAGADNWQFIRTIPFDDSYTSLTFVPTETLIILDAPGHYLSSEQIWLYPFTSRQRAYILALNYLLGLAENIAIQSTALDAGAQKTLIDGATRTLISHPLLYTFSIPEPSNTGWKLVQSAKFINHFILTLHKIRALAQLPEIRVQFFGQLDA